ncbi:hypothetical protein AB4072_00890 [Microvirga sp. 2MCAF38]|uniref:hypothetical protein n=1 Tax=Microvirga sp. 2MCAF38 TaxID=3232989 RepID=UPI003F9BA791
MKLVSGTLAAALLLSIQPVAAQSSNNNAGAFGAMNPGAYGNGGGGQSDNQKILEETVKKMRDGTYTNDIRKAQENVEAYARLRAREGKIP